MAKLFLTCPTDFLERPIQKAFKSECFFYTALGLNFHWSRNSVFEIQHLIEQYLIDDIVLVSDYKNRFYMQYLEKEEPLQGCFALVEIYKTLKIIQPALYFTKTIDDKLQTLASLNLLEQENKLKQKIDSKKHYRISTLLFDRQSQLFFKPNITSLITKIHFN